MSNKEKEYERFFSKSNVNAGGDNSAELGNLNFTIGIICNGNNQADINYYAREFDVINRHFKGKVKLMFIGGDPLLGGVKYQCTKPVSIIHYEKHLKQLNIDLLFIPLIPNNFNLNSENYNKFLEAASLQVPVITTDQYPYSAIIENKINGFLYSDKSVFLDYLNDLLIKNYALVKICGKNAKDMVREHLSFTEGNINEILNALD